MRSNWNRLRSRGFTLVEILIVLGILAVIIGISTSGIIVQQKKSRDARRKADLEVVRGALERYRMEAPTPGSYPPTPTGTLTYDLDAYTSALASYMTSVPKDPKSGQKYQIDIRPGSYSLQTAMEYDLITPPACPLPTGLLSCKGTSQSCTYCVNNP